jgi:hypothetical protein
LSKNTLGPLGVKTTSEVYHNHAYGVIMGRHRGAKRVLMTKEEQLIANTISELQRLWHPISLNGRSLTYARCVKIPSWWVFLAEDGCDGRRSVIQSYPYISPMVWRLVKHGGHAQATWNLFMRTWSLFRKQTNIQQMESRTATN